MGCCFRERENSMRSTPGLGSKCAWEGKTSPAFQYTLRLLLFSSCKLCWSKMGWASRAALNSHGRGNMGTHAKTAAAGREILDRELEQEERLGYPPAHSPHKSDIHTCFWKKITLELQSWCLKHTCTPGSDTSFPNHCRGEDFPYISPRSGRNCHHATPIRHFTTFPVTPPPEILNVFLLDQL